MKHFTIISYCFFIVILLSSCSSGGGVAGPVFKTFTISNPHQGDNAINATNEFVDVKLIIAIRTLDANNNATSWGTPFVKTYSIGSSALYNFGESIQVPESGSFVIQINTEALECTADGISAPCNSLYGAKKFFEKLSTYIGPDGGNYQFYLTPYYNTCCP